MEKRIPDIPAHPLPFIRYVTGRCKRSAKIQFTLAVLAEACATVFDVLITWSLGRIVGVMVDAAPGTDIWPLMIHENMILAAIWIGRNISYRMRTHMERLYVPELLNTTRRLLFNRLIHQSQDFLQANFAGVLANHVRRAGEAINGLRDKVTCQVIPLIVRFATAGVLLWSVTPTLTLYIFGFALISMVLSVLRAPRLMQLSTADAQAYSQLSGYIVDSTTNLSVVQQNTGWEEEQRLLGYAHETLTKTYQARLLFLNWFWGGFDILMTIFFCGFMFLVAQTWQEGHIATADLAMIVGLLTTLLLSLMTVVSLMNKKFEDFGLLRESLEKISTPLSIEDVPHATELKIANGTIEFRDVTFSYKEGVPVFENVSLRVESGQKVGIVGVSGAGKTTLCQLLLRAWDVDQGGIYIDGQNIVHITQDSLRAAIAIIPQDPVLFHRSLADNIGYGSREADDHAVHDAARAAEAAEFIEVLPDGYNTLVGERGVKLSGGQRQRVAIARAILKNAPILILDEATSALDSETEKAIQLAMAKAMKGRTTLVIAHRLSTLSHMDRIIVMDQGKIIEDGTFQDLIGRADGHFSRLWTMQAGGFLPG